VSFATLHKFVTYTMAGLGLVCLFLGGEVAIPIQIASVLAFVASMFAEGPRIHHPLWTRGWNVVLLALLALEVLRGVLGEPLLPLALEFAAALQISRLCNRRTAAEHRQIAMLAFLHLCAATVLSTEVVYAFAFLGFVVVAPWMLALTHLRSEIEGHYPGADEPARASDVQRVLASRRVVGASFLAGTAALSLPLFACTAVLFLMFPRVGMGLLSFGGAPGNHVAGFGGDVELGQVGLVRDDPSVVLRVAPIGIRERPPPRVALRLRGTSFDHYDGRRWTRSSREPISVERVDATYPITRLPDPTRDVAYSIVLEHLQETVVFLPEGTVAIDIPPRVRSGYEVGRRLSLAPGLDLRYEDDDALGLRYVAWIGRDTRRLSREQLSATDVQRYLQIPEGHERVAELARQWTEGVEGDRARAARIVERLGSFAYSVDMRDPGGRPPLEAFLFDWRSGHCEYFSTAMAIMLRGIGIPARNVTGFLGGRWNPFGRYYAITQGDAHSWVEAWIEGEGWVTFDPTPPSRSEVELAFGTLDDLAALFDALRTRWEEDVVAYDLRAQRALARRIARFFASLGSSGAGEAGVRVAARTERRAPPPWSRPTAVVGGMVLVLVLVLYHALRRRNAGDAGYPPIPEAAREAVALYRALEQVLAGLGRPRPPSRTPREHAEALVQESFPHADAVRAITERYLEARYGGVPIERGELARLRALLREVERAPRT
jgi:transglutaminase-like putative cysteine protease